MGIYPIFRQTHIAKLGSGRFTRCIPCGLKNVSHQNDRFVPKMLRFVIWGWMLKPIIFDEHPSPCFVINTIGIKVLIPSHPSHLKNRKLEGVTFQFRVQTFMVEAVMLSCFLCFVIFVWPAVSTFMTKLEAFLNSPGLVIVFTPKPAQHGLLSSKRGPVIESSQATWDSFCHHFQTTFWTPKKLEIVAAAFRLVSQARPNYKAIWNIKNPNMRDQL